MVPAKFQSAGERMTHGWMELGHTKPLSASLDFINLVTTNRRNYHGSSSTRSSAESGD